MRFGTLDDQPQSNGAQGSGKSGGERGDFYGSAAVEGFEIFWRQALSWSIGMLVGGENVDKHRSVSGKLLLTAGARDADDYRG
jgi:hypothetical protein